MKSIFSLFIGVAVLSPVFFFGNYISVFDQENNNNSNRPSSSNKSPKNITQNTGTQEPSPGGPGGGGPSSGGGSGPRRQAARIANEASKLINEIMSRPDNAIPKGILDKAEAIAIFPGVVKAAFIIGGRGGQGVIVPRIHGGWGTPVFFNISGGSIGAQIGAAKTDHVLLIMNQEGLRGLLEDRFELDSEAGVAAGPVGRTASASTNQTLDAGIFSYSRSKGAFFGADIKGTVISPDNNLNEAIYGKKANDILSNTIMTTSSLPAEVRILPRTLARYSRR